jgi:hypothetical protein
VRGGLCPPTQCTTRQVGIRGYCLSHCKVPSTSIAPRTPTSCRAAKEHALNYRWRNSVYDSSKLKVLGSQGRSGDFKGLWNPGIFRTIGWNVANVEPDQVYIHDSTLNSFLLHGKHIYCFYYRVSDCFIRTSWKRINISSQNTVFARKKCFGAPGGSKESFSGETRRLVYLVATFIKWKPVANVLYCGFSLFRLWYIEYTNSNSNVYRIPVAGFLLPAPQYGCA